MHAVSWYLSTLKLSPDDALDPCSSYILRHLLYETNIMKLSGWMVLPLVLGLSSVTVACDAGGEREGEEQFENEPTGVEPFEGEEEGEEREGDD